MSDDLGFFPLAVHPFIQSCSTLFIEYLLYVQHMTGKVLAQIKDSITESSFPFFPWKILPAGEMTLLTTRPPILDARESCASVGLAAPERRSSCPSGSHSRDNDLERGQA